MIKTLFSPQNHSLKNHITLVLLTVPLFIAIIPQTSDAWYQTALLYLWPLIFLPLALEKVDFISLNFLKYTNLWLLFLGITFLTLLSSASVGISLSIFLKYSFFFIYSVYFYLTINTPTKILSFIKLLFLIAGILLILGLLISLLNLQIPDINLFVPNHSHNPIANFLVMLFPFLLLLPRDSKKINLLNNVLFLTLILITFSRSAIVITISMIVTSMVYFHKKITNFSIIIFCFFLIFIAVLFLLPSLYFQQTQLSPTQTKSSWFLRQTYKPLEFEGRPNYFLQAITAFEQHPLTGYGPGTFELISYKYRKQTNQFTQYSHNEFLTILAEQGLIGITSLSLLIAFILKNLFVHFHPKNRFSKSLPQSLNAAISLSIIVTIIQSFFQFNFQYYLISLVFWSFCTYNLAKNQKIKIPKIYKRAMVTIAILLATTSGLIISSKLVFFIPVIPPTTQSKLSTYLVPFDQTIFKNHLTLTQHSEIPLSTNYQSWINFWYSQHPLINNLLLKHFESNSEMFTTLSITNTHLNPLDRSTYQYLIHHALTTQNISQAIYYLIYSYNQTYTDFGITNSQVSTYIQKTESIKLAPILTPAYIKKISHYLNSSHLEQDLYYSAFFYDLGYQYLQKSDLASAETFWYLAANTSPQWSVFQIELSSLYHSLGNEPESFRIINLCLNRIHTRRDCAEFLNQIKDNNLLPGSQYSSFQQTLLEFSGWKM